MPPRGSYRNVYTAGTVACLTSMLFGYAVGYIGGIIVLPSFLAHFDLLKLKPSELASAQAFTVTAWILGCIIGVPLARPICGKLGRKACLTFTAVVYLIGAGLQLSDLGGPTGLKVFMLGRIINGIAVGAGTLVGPMYISEISPPEVRGTLLAGYQVLLQLGAGIGFWAAYFAHQRFPDTSSLQYMIPVSVQILPGLFLLFGIAFIPEVPYFDMRNDNVEKATKNLAWLRCLPEDDPVVEQEINLIDDALAKEFRSEKVSFWKEISKKGMRIRGVIGVGIMVAQNCAGLNAINFYGPSIFRSAGFTTTNSMLFLTGLYGIVKLVLALLFTFYLVKRGGNRFWLLSGSAVCAGTMLVLAFLVRSLIPAAGSPPTPPTDGYTLTGVLSVVMVYVYTSAFTVSLGPISWSICAEIFPPSIKPMALMLTTMTQWIFQLFVAYITPHLLEIIGWGTYLFYGCACITIFLFVYFFIPETSGLSLLEMDKVFGVPEAVEIREVTQINERSSLLSGQIDTRRYSSTSFV